MIAIVPTIGRIVHYFPHLNEQVAKGSDNGPHAALIAHVWSEGLVNLGVIDTNGVAYSRTSVLLLQEGDERPSSGGYACWMPYQVVLANVAPILKGVAAEPALVDAYKEFAPVAASTPPAEVVEGSVGMTEVAATDTPA